MYDGKSVYCAKVNSKNRMGGYNGFTNVIAIGNDVEFKSDEDIHRLDVRQMELYYERANEVCRNEGPAVDFKQGRAFVRRALNLKDGESVDFLRERQAILKETTNYCGLAVVSNSSHLTAKSIWFIAKGSNVEVVDAEDLKEKGDQEVSYLMDRIFATCPS